LAAPLGRAWWHFGEGEGRGCVVGLEVLFNNDGDLAERGNRGYRAGDIAVLSLV
jgi:hypothetical protein